MKFFEFGKKDKILDLSDYKEQGNKSDTENSSEDFVLDSEKIQSSEEKKKKFAKRITNLIDTVENLSNQIYHLQQRTELLEKKLNIKVE